MDIQATHRPLFDYDVSQLKLLLDEMDPALWYANPMRQRSFVRQQETKSIIFVWTDIEDNLYEGVQIILPESSSPLAQEVWKIGEQIRLQYGEGSKITRMLLANLPAGGNIGLHADIRNLCLIHRNHLPIITNESCMFEIEGVSYNFPEGKALEINNQKLHSVANGGASDRIHLICDILEADTIQNIDNYVVHNTAWWNNG